MIIAVDFDGTLCVNKYPEIGKPKKRIIKYLLKRRKKGDKLILWTCREKEMLCKAVAWCAYKGLWFDAINENLPEQIKLFGNDCRKIGADIYLDDKGRRVRWVLDLLTEEF